MTTETGTDVSAPKRGKGAFQIVALIAIIYVAARLKSDAASILLLFAMLLSGLSIIRPIPAYGVPTRGYGVAVFFSVLIGGLLAISIAATQNIEAELASLKSSDTAAYLTALKEKGDQERWLEELRVLAPDRYPAEKQRFDTEQANFAAKRAEEAEQQAWLKVMEAKNREREKAAATARAGQEEAHAREYGFHCLSTWDGSHPAIKDAVKSALRAPGSFEHVDTVAFPVSAGRNKIIMTYRAQNGFGGTNVERAVGSFDNTTCDARVEMIE
ncbi:hypothetical protein [Paracoccus sp. AS002]|uniref:hypothetical protein n=1 Tax=Paracoccus sp. AS002 TaxID=3019545 RepID=UPI0023E8CA95|nr:hypothetical protein [Paracoccus sp. AS002]MDF3907266.1 hypothetical protein [Paracoccus sp. AS002]